MINTEIVISDLSLPEKDGLFLLNEIKKIDPQIRVIIMTAFSTVKSAIEAMKLGASAQHPSASCALAEGQATSKRAGC